MNGNLAVRTGRWLRGQVYRRAEHSQLIIVPEPNATELVADDSYVRIRLSEFWLATDRSWGFGRTPVVRASAQALFGKPDQRAPDTTILGQQKFAILVKPEAGAGVFMDYSITGWIPYQGQAIELEAALYPVLGKNRLLTAVDILSEFASLVTPPISAALTVVDRMTAGIDKVVRSSGTEPALQLHTSLTAPGWVAVVAAPVGKLPRAELDVNDSGQLCRDGKQLTEYDYLVLRVESRRERDDWRTPDLDLAIAAACHARDVDNAKKVYKRRYDEALSKIYYSPDFTTSQRRKLALVVKEELDETSYGVVSDGGVTLADIVARRGLPSDSDVEFLTLDDLISE